VLPNGDTVALERGQQRIRNRQFKFYGERGGLYTGDIPSYSWRRVKNAAGYFAENDFDLADLFIGQEGTLESLHPLFCALACRRNHVWGVLFQFRTEENAISFVKEARSTMAEVLRQEVLPRKRIRRLWLWNSLINCHANYRKQYRRENWRFLIRMPPRPFTWSCMETMKLPWRKSCLICQEWWQAG